MGGTFRIKLLLVDDMDGIHIGVRKLIAVPPPLEVDLLSAYSIDEAFEVIQKNPPHCILLDLHYAASDTKDHGVEYAIKAIAPLAQHAPVIALTGYGTDDLWSKCIEAGACNFLSKEVYMDLRNRPFFLQAITNAIFLHEAKLKGAAA